MLREIKKMLGLSLMKNQELWVKIQNSPLVLAGDDNLIDRVIKETNWSKSKVKDVILAYKKFLYLAAINKEVVPSKEVDAVWHNHILFTNDYFVRWSNILGKTVHHSPEIKGIKNTYNNTYKETYNSYTNEFGKNDDSIMYFMLLNNNNDYVIESNSYQNKHKNHHSCSSNSINIEESHKTPHQPWSDYPSTPKSDSISNYHNHHWDNYSATHDSPSTHHSCSSHNHSSSSDSGSSSSCSSSSCGSSCGGGGD